MKRLSTLIACLVVVFAGAADSLAQVSPVVAKIRITYYRIGSDGKEVVWAVRNGHFYRSSTGTTMETHFGVDDEGKRLENGRSHFFEILNGKRTAYDLDHNHRSGALRQQIEYAPYRPPEDFKHPTHEVERDTVQGLRCLKIPVTNGRGEVTGRTWQALDIDDLTVKREVTRRDGRRFVKELYDIEFSEPDPSKLALPSGYAIDESNCQGCDKH